MTSDEITTDTVLGGRVTLLQPARGFRSSLDPVLLAAFVDPPFGRFVDIGCGTGALSFVLAARDPRASGVAVEIQARLADLARSGVERNRLGDRVRIVHGDARVLAGHASSGLAAGAFDLVAANPPYRAVGSGVLSPDPERAQANHELTLALDEWLDVAARLARPGGRVAVVYPAARLDELDAGLRARGVAPSRLRAVHPRPGQPASRVLVEAVVESVAGIRVVGSRRQPRHEPPLILHREAGPPDVPGHGGRDGGVYTMEALRMLGEPLGADPTAMKGRSQ